MVVASKTTLLLNPSKDKGTTKHEEIKGHKRLETDGYGHCVTCKSIRDTSDRGRELRRERDRKYGSTYKKYLKQIRYRLKGKIARVEELERFINEQENSNRAGESRFSQD